jgi:hypothetical protein
MLSISARLRGIIISTVGVQDSLDIQVITEDRRSKLVGVNAIVNPLENEVLISNRLASRRTRHPNIIFIQGYMEILRRPT